MTGDWIRMRVWLRKDPRVASMADYLATDRKFIRYITDPVQASCKESVYEHITSDVTRSITVTSLLEVWGVARERGDRDGDDLILKHCDLSNLDDLCSTPGFGEAMEYVEWAIQEIIQDQKGREVYCIRFPKFFKDQDTPDVRYRKQHAEAQAKYRNKSRQESDGKSDVTSDITRDITSDITVTPREEKRREENNTPPTPSLEPKKPKAAFKPPTLEEVRAFSEERKAAGAPFINPGRFFDYYTANGWMASKVKMKDWKSAFRNWERNQSERDSAKGGHDEPSIPFVSRDARERAKQRQKDAEERRLADEKLVREMDEAMAKRLKGGA